MDSDWNTDHDTKVKDSDDQSLGPLVSEVRPLQDLADQWSGASNTIKEKLNNLIATYPSWRRIRGDGSCGFRCLLFGWFEVWLRLNDAKLLQAGTQAIATKWGSLGIDDLYSDWIDSVTDLSAQVVEAMSAGEDAEAALMRAFNDEDANNELMQFLRTLTSSEMKANAEQYQAILDYPVEQWCLENVDVPTAEMDFPSLVAAYNAMARAANITVHIIYVDNSEGKEANVHDLEPDHPSEGREMWMLYRPGHYDLVYKN